MGYLERQQGVAVEDVEHGEVQAFALQKLSLLFGFVDGLQTVWTECVDQPQDLRALATRGRERQHAIFKHAEREAVRWERELELGSFEAFGALPPGRDLARFFEELKSRNVRTLVLILPKAHTGLVERIFSRTARAK